MKPLGWLTIGVAVAVLITGALSDSSPFGGWPPAGGEPYVGPEQPPSPEYPWGRPTQTGIVPTLILQDSYGVNHTLRSQSVPLSVAGEPTIPASRGKIYLSLTGYFEVDPALIERYGAVAGWSLTGLIDPIICEIVTGTCLGLGSFSFAAEGQGAPTQAFTIYLTGGEVLSASTIIAGLESGGSLRSGIYELRWIHDRTSLRLSFASGDGSGSVLGREQFAASRFEYSHGQIVFFDTAEVDRLSAETSGLSILDGWLPKEPRVRLF